MNDKKLYSVLPYIPKLSDKLEIILKKSNLSVTFKTSNTTQSLFNSGEDKTSPILSSGAYRIPCSYGCFYAGRTQLQLGKRLSEDRSSIDKAIGLCQRPDIYDSALPQPVYDNPNHFIVFDNKSIIAPVKGLMQVFRKAVEIKKHIHLKITFNRDTGETTLSLIYNEFNNSDHFYIRPQNYNSQCNRVSDNTLSGKRLAFKNVLHKIKF